MDFTFSLGYVGAALLIVGAVVGGVALYLIGNPHFGCRWLVTAIAAVVGGFIASEFVMGFRSWDPVVDGLATGSALIGGLLIGLAAAAATRYLGAGTPVTGSAH